VSRYEQLALRVGPDLVTGAESRRRVVAHDASHYLLVPEAVATPRSVPDMARLFAACRDLGVPLTFRSGGSSLSGQGCTEHLLVDTRRGFREVEVLDDGRRVRVQPGLTIGQVNARLAPYRRRLGPDPASESACTIGGLIANNSSGMTCGTEFNTYRTLESAVLVLASGTVLDTAAPDADERLRALEPELHAELLRLRDEVRSDPAAVATIGTLYSIKNTMGYGVNSFLDHERAVDILLHLVVGSEGTLAFVASAVFGTVPVHPHLATGLLVFATLAEATAVLSALSGTGPKVIELLDRTSLAVCQRDPRGGARLAGIEVREHAALLVEYQEDDPAALAARTEAAARFCAGLELARPATLTGDKAERADLWHLRKGLYTTVAGNRPQRTNALLEDVAVPLDNLLPLCEQLLVMFDEHGYQDSVIFGHAKDGNVHFLLNERFDDGPSLRRYEEFTDAMVDLVLGLDGTLKAEHGTGRIMAPFVARQYGEPLFGVMRRVKRAFDPAGILNPGVLLTEDPRIHLRHLKTAPPVEQEVDRCVECGYCEPVCPSRDLSMTPRQRIVLRREIEAARLAGDTERADRLERESRYGAVDTCAADSLCALACPLGIDTGALVKRQRRESGRRVDEALWGRAAEHWGAVTRAGAVALSAAHRAPGAASRMSLLGRTLLGVDTVPAYSGELPAGGAVRTDHDAPDAEVVLFSSCLNTLFGSAGGIGADAALRALCDRAGVRWRTPGSLATLCCTMPWTSKGLTGGAASMSRRVADALWTAGEQGRLPVVCDAVSCSEGLEHVAEAAAGQGRELRIEDAVSYAHRVLLPRLHDLARIPADRRLGSAMVHPTCSTQKGGSTAALVELARACADRVDVPTAWGCCAFAGDRGLLHPELTAAATAPEAGEVRAGEHDVYLSANRTCELGMTRATGSTYIHVLELLERLTR
jgi:D-lactate dehydrogenase